MPAKSRAQQRLMGLAYGNPEVRNQIGISKKDARKFAKTKHAGLPEKVNEDLLQPLWELFDELQPEAPDYAMGTPQKGDYEHPVIKQRKMVDQLRGSGMEPEDAHQQVYGEVDLADVESKKSIASTFGRVQDDGNKNYVKIEKDAEFKSLLAKDDELEKQLDATTPIDLRTPQGQQVPDSQQPDDQGVDMGEEYDYNLDVAYLQTYGRA